MPKWCKKKREEKEIKLYFVFFFLMFKCCQLPIIVYLKLTDNYYISVESQYLIILTICTIMMCDKM